MDPTAANPTLTTNELLYTLAALLVALSVASERLVEIIKGAIPALNNENADLTREGWRKAVIQALAVGSGVLTALLARPALNKVLPDPWDKTGTYVALGFLTSGGSGFWNGVLGYIQNVKDIKKSLAARGRQSGGAMGAGEVR